MSSDVPGAASARVKADKPKAGKVESISIRPASNGFVVEVFRGPSKSAKGPIGYDAPEKSVHESAEGVLEVVSGLIGGKDDE